MDGDLIKVGESKLKKKDGGYACYEVMHCSIKNDLLVTLIIFFLFKKSFSRKKKPYFSKTFKIEYSK